MFQRIFILIRSDCILKNTRFNQKILCFKEFCLIWSDLSQVIFKRLTIKNHKLKELSNS